MKTENEAEQRSSESLEQVLEAHKRKLDELFEQYLGFLDQYEKARERLSSKLASVRD